jgi:hypothetical protein
MLSFQEQHLENLQRLREGVALANLPPIKVTIQPVFTTIDLMTQAKEEVIFL